VTAAWPLWALFLTPLFLALASLGLPTPRAALRFGLVGTVGWVGLALSIGWLVAGAEVGEPRYAAGRWFMLDALSALHLMVMALVYGLSAAYGQAYFGRLLAQGHLGHRQMRRYHGLWFGSLAAMVLVLLANNLGVMWVGIEATTLLTAFLICTETSPASLEAMWKYLLVCSVGVALAFVGTLLVVASAAVPAGPAAGDGSGGLSPLTGTGAMLWTSLRAAASDLHPVLLKAGFAFVVVGYGTKAGLAPMHNWLPDAHSQAPAPVSAVFSGFLLNSALYCILRYLPIVEAGTGGSGWGRGMLVVFGLLSLAVAAVFTMTQTDVKRLLAYCSVEHLGIVAIGVGLGGMGVFAGLLHTVGHSLAKTVSFGCAGRAGQLRGSHDIRQLGSIAATAPVWGVGLVASVLALGGLAPFSLFASEFMVVRAAAAAGSWWVAAAFLGGVAVVFIAMLRGAMGLAWGPRGDSGSDRLPWRWQDAPAVFLPLLALLLVGVWLPPAVRQLVERAALLVAAPPL
jgi:hydrogenase-4 component F